MQVSRGEAEAPSKRKYSARNSFLVIVSISGNGVAVRSSMVLPHTVCLVVWMKVAVRAQELCGSRGGRPGLPSLISLRFLWT